MVGGRLRHEMGDNHTGIDPEACQLLDTPTTAHFFEHITPFGIGVLVFCTCFTLANITIFLEKAVFIIKNFKNDNRRWRTLTLLAIYPSFSVTSLMAIYVPRSSTLMDLVMASVFGYILFSFMELVVDYFGGRKPMMKRTKGSDVALRSSLCCCCFCLPTIKFTLRQWRVIQFLVLQNAVLRAVFAIIAAVLWTDGLYNPSDMTPGSLTLWLIVVNLVSTTWAVYGLILMLSVCSQPLAAFSIRAKFYSIQVIILTSSLLSLICGAIAKSIPCVPPFNSKDKASRMYHICLIVEMLPLALMARHFFLNPVEYSASGHEAESSKDDNNAAAVELMGEQPVTNAGTTHTEQLYPDLESSFVMSNGNHEPLDSVA